MIIDHFLNSPKPVLELLCVYCVYRPIGIISNSIRSGEFIYPPDEKRFRLIVVIRDAPIRISTTETDLDINLFFCFV